MCQQTPHHHNCCCHGPGRKQSSHQLCGLDHGPASWAGGAFRGSCVLQERSHHDLCTLTTDEKIARLEQTLECKRADLAALEARLKSLEDSRKER